MQKDYVDENKDYLKENVRLFKLWRTSDALATFFSMLGLGFSILFYEWHVLPWIAKSENMIQCVDDSNETPCVAKKRETILRPKEENSPILYAIVLTTAIAVIFVLARECIKSFWVKRYRNFEEKTVDSLDSYKNAIITNSQMTFEGKRIHSGSKASALTIELLILLVIPIPNNYYVVVLDYEDSDGGGNFTTK